MQVVPNPVLLRRAALRLSITGLAASAGSGFATADQTASHPRQGDLLVFEEGDRAGTVISVSDMVAGNPPVRGWAMDPASGAVRDWSRLDQILLVRLRPAQLSATTVPFAADGIVGFSAICTHAGCLVSGWKPAEALLLCPCHGSVYDPAAGGRVVAGPAPRPLPALPLRVSDSALTVAGGFTARIGGSTGRTD